MEKKYINITTYVDEETGEIIDKHKFAREYYKTNTTIKKDYKENLTITYYTHECKHKGQYRINF